MKGRENSLTAQISKNTKHTRNFENSEKVHDKTENYNDKRYNNKELQR